MCSFDFLIKKKKNKLNVMKFKIKKLNGGKLNEDTIPKNIKKINSMYILWVNLI